MNPASIGENKPIDSIISQHVYERANIIYVYFTLNHESRFDLEITFKVTYNVKYFNNFLI